MIQAVRAHCKRRAKGAARPETDLSIQILSFALRFLRARTCMGRLDSRRRGAYPDRESNSMENQETNASEQDEVRFEPVRRPYERPRILSREPLEAVAAVCSPPGVAKSNPGLCPSGPISS